MTYHAKRVVCALCGAAYEWHRFDHHRLQQVHQEAATRSMMDRAARLAKKKN